MKNRQNKKGFTLVELLVVIAIVAILATVSIVGYLSFTNKAKESNDQSLVKQLNIVLAGNEATDGNNKTYSEAIEDMEKAGFSVEKMTPTATKHDILWDQVSDRFVLIKENNVALKDDKTNVDLEKKNLLWKMYDEVPAEQDYSIYLKGTETLIENEITLKTGFDAGKNAANYKLFYNGNIPANERVIIKTNGSDSELRVNTTTSTVEHYGNLGKVNIEQVPATDCYHEFGKTVYAVLAKGKLVVEPSSSIEILNVTAETKDAVELEVKDKAKVEKPYCANSTVLEEIKAVVSTATEKQTADIVKEVETSIDAALAEQNNADVKISKVGKVNDYLSLEEFRDNTNTGNTYEGYNVKLLRNVDLKGKAWTPIGISLDQPFKGYFDGNNKTISNLTMNSNAGKTGLFGVVVGSPKGFILGNNDIPSWDPFFNKNGDNQIDKTYFSEDKFTTSIKNLFINNANIDNQLNNGACNGVLAGLVKDTFIENVRVTNSTIKGVQHVGGLVGWIYGTFQPGNAGNKNILTDFSVFKNNVIENTIIVGKTQHVGGMVGKAYDGSAFIDNKVLGCDITCNDKVGGLIGDIQFGVLSGNKVGTLVREDLNNPKLTTITSNGGNCMQIGGMIGKTWRVTLFVDCHNESTIISANNENCIGGMVGDSDSWDENRYTDFYGCSNTGILPNEGTMVGEIIGHSNHYHKLYDETHLHDSTGRDGKQLIGKCDIREH